MNTEFIINGLMLLIGVGLLAAGIISLVRHRILFGTVATVVGAVMLIIVLLTTSVSQSSGASADQGQVNAPIIDNGAIVTGKITEINRLEPSNAWQIKIQADRIGNDGGLPNPISDRVGQILNVRTDLDVSNYKVGQQITGVIKLNGDVERGTFFYLSAVQN